VEAFASAEEFVNSNNGNNRSCLILDVQLPRMSGLELQQHLSNKSDSVPIIFVTAHANDEVRSRALQEGAVSFYINRSAARIFLGPCMRLSNRP